ncbi:helix-turn-helix domain-containing protein [Leptolyngbya sp. KIOST-1]|uniref:helix-turn-helix domain-containing protein n=1 Tax=Leptolyngbya sp. KIOST-1 TaxID=1229172 RepID=UPI00055B0F90|nr:helix-turn-helix transcriptional regulator [Leptolyngbya sp. KIOST-1]
MKSGTKYYPLYDHLKQSQKTEVALTFAEIEGLLGIGLPASARDRKTWWHNRATPAAQQASAWVGAGYHVQAIDIASKTVTFRRADAQPTSVTQDGKIIWQQDAIRALRKHLSLTQMQFAEQMGVRRQTISEWENGIYEPDRSTAKFLELIAKQANFEISTAVEDQG